MAPRVRPATAGVGVLLLVGAVAVSMLHAAHGDSVCLYNPFLYKGTWDCSLSATSSTCNARCNSGYTLEGPGRVIQCSSSNGISGTWTLPKVQCRVECTYPPIPDYAAMNCDCTLERCRCFFTCLDGYAHTAGDRSYICTPDSNDIGRWVGEPFVCKRKCPEFNVLGHGRMHCDVNPIEGETCESRCDPGYVVVWGSASRTCTGNGWTGSDAVCDKVCGNGVIDAGEECDDGNSLNTDDCSNLCHVITGSSIADLLDGFLKELYQGRFEADLVLLGTALKYAGHNQLVQLSVPLAQLSQMQVNVTLALHKIVDGEAKYLFTAQQTEEQAADRPTTPGAELGSLPLGKLQLDFAVTNQKWEIYTMPDADRTQNARLVPV